TVERDNVFEVNATDQMPPLYRHERIVAQESTGGAQLVTIHIEEEQVCRCAQPEQFGQRVHDGLSIAHVGRQLRCDRIHSREQRDEITQAAPTELVIAYLLPLSNRLLD